MLGYCPPNLYLYISYQWRHLRQKSSSTNSSIFLWFLFRWMKIWGRKDLMFKRHWAVIRENTLPQNHQTVQNLLLALFYSVHLEFSHCWSASGRWTAFSVKAVFGNYTGLAKEGCFCKQNQGCSHKDFIMICFIFSKNQFSEDQWKVKNST